MSFTKGCYTGQELVARIDSPGGNVPRHLRGLVLAGDQVPPPGAELALVEPDARWWAHVTSARLVAAAWARRSAWPSWRRAVELGSGRCRGELGRRRGRAARSRTLPLVAPA